MEIFHPQANITDYVVKIGGHSISGVIWNDFCVVFKLDRVFIPGNYTFEIYQVYRLEETQLENLCDLTEIYQTIADQYLLDFSDTNSIAIFEDGLLPDLNSSEY